MFYPHPSHTLTSCSSAAFALILVSYITQLSPILLSVSHISAIFPVNCQLSKLAPAAVHLEKTRSSRAEAIARAFPYILQGETVLKIFSFLPVSS